MPSGPSAGAKLHKLTIGWAGRLKPGLLRISKYGMLRLDARTAPASCVVGDLYVSSADQKLRLCTVAGTPGTWTVVGTQA